MDQPVLDTNGPASKFIEITAHTLPNDGAMLAERLVSSLEVWGSQGARSVRITLPSSQAELVPIFTRVGFEFQHCHDNTLILRYRYNPEAEALGGPTHYLGVGSIVFDGKGNVLTVVDDRDRDKEPKRYKLPGGFVDQHEHISAAAVREVREETGIDARFTRAICMMHWHKTYFQKSSIYTVCQLEYLSGTPQAQEGEIAECRWLPIETFCAAEGVADFYKYTLKLALGSTGIVHSHRVPGYEAREVFVPEESLQLD